MCQAVRVRPRESIRDAADYSELTRAQIAAQFGVSSSTVSAIAAGRAHRYLDGAR
ncbi:MAG: hypothetical protein ACLQDY_15675 [Streptosporangiaceae bacterium]